MHFLCLHGLGTNSYVFETQTGELALAMRNPGAANVRNSATLRHDMDQHDTFDFAEAGRECPIADGAFDARRSSLYVQAIDGTQKSAVSSLPKTLTTDITGITRPTCLSP